MNISDLRLVPEKMCIRDRRLNDDSRKDAVVTFEELGIDRLFIDEAHSFKNRAKRCAISYR